MKKRFFIAVFLYENCILSYLKMNVYAEIWDVTSSNVYDVMTDAIIDGDSVECNPNVGM